MSTNCRSKITHRWESVDDDDEAPIFLCSQKKKLTMADNLVELDDLLRRLHAKESAAAKTATSPSAPKVEETTRPFQTLCNEAIRAYGDGNVQNGETTLDALREEVASAGVSGRQATRPTAVKCVRRKPKRAPSAVGRYVRFRAFAPSPPPSKGYAPPGPGPRHC